jgi:hypothetical protein
MQIGACLTSFVLLAAVQLFAQEIADKLSVTHITASDAPNIRHVSPSERHSQSG